MGNLCSLHNPWVQLYFCVTLWCKVDDYTLTKSQPPCQWNEGNTEVLKTAVLVTKTGKSPSASIFKYPTSCTNTGTGYSQVQERSLQVACLSTRTSYDLPQLHQRSTSWHVIWEIDRGRTTKTAAARATTLWNLWVTSQRLYPCFIQCDPNPLKWNMLQWVNELIINDNDLKMCSYTSHGVILHVCCWH